jgi:2'-5' RNA ligase
VPATVHPLNSLREPSLDALMQLVAADMNGVNAVILERMQSKVALIPELAGHLIAGGGKRMRPMLTLARWKGRRTREVASFLERKSALASQPFAVDAFSLFESHLSRHGAHYQEAERFLLE